MAQNKTVIYQMLNSLVTALKPIGAKTYLLNRPRKVDEKMDKFIVVDMPTQLRRTAKGYDKYRYETTGVIYAFVRAQTDGSPNIDRQTQFISDIKELFPITDDIIECVNPNELMRGLDETNFQVTTITFALRTKVNAFRTE